ncbi:MAG: hypothetical protein D6682_05160 [Zetaproteobacteria bacterium]|nr:MAG: hypothetical protein D6682_05160 [Zetaproteobacteria bacterium]
MDARMDALHHRIVTSHRPAPPPREGRDEGLWRVSLQFEALFLQQVMSEMRKSVPQSDVLPHGFAEESYRSMMDQAIAEAGGRRGSLGIAATIYAQLKQRRDGAEVAGKAVAEASKSLHEAAAAQYRALAAKGEVE